MAIDYEREILIRQEREIHPELNGCGLWADEDDDYEGSEEYTEEAQAAVEAAYDAMRRR